MKKLAVIVILALAGWSGWWWLGAAGGERALTEWLDQRRTEGWAADIATTQTRGYPLSFRRELTDVQLADPATGVAWQAPQVILTSPSYAPADLSLTLPTRQTLAIPGTTLEIASTLFEAALNVAPTENLALKSADLRLRDLRVGSSAGWMAGLAQGDVTSVRAEAPDAHAVSAVFTDVMPSDPVKAILDPLGALPDAIERMELRGTFGFDAPWDLRALEDRRPQPTRIDLDALTLIWGGIEINVAGAMDVDAQGRPEGDLTVQIVNWRDLLALLQANGTLPQEIDQLALTIIDALARSSGRPDTLDAPLALSGGFVRFGPIPIGPAPRLTIR